MKINFILNNFSKSTQISNFIKIRQVGAKLSNADGRTDVSKLTVAFRNVANASKNVVTNATELSVGFHGSSCCSRVMHTD